MRQDKIDDGLRILQAVGVMAHSSFDDDPDVSPQGLVAFFDHRGIFRYGHHLVGSAATDHLNYDPCHC